MGGRLTLSLDGEDVTCLSLREKQLAVNESLVINYRILVHRNFCSQYFFDGLLEESDVGLKKKLNVGDCENVSGINWD